MELSAYQRPDLARIKVSHWQGQHQHVAVFLGFKQALLAHKELLQPDGVQRSQTFSLKEIGKEREA